MSTVTISVSDEMKAKMHQFPEMNWSAVARKAILERIRLMEKMDKLLSKSELTEADAISLGGKIKSNVSKRFMER
ncbi:MAG: hypothetical protein HY393_02515 [Candidatus Diapherotrites archaeon]|nr:hypothetical protein [Candidatus Diapherotrites archaeon]